MAIPQKQCIDGYGEVMSELSIGATVAPDHVVHTVVTTVNNSYVYTDCLLEKLSSARAALVFHNVCAFLVFNLK